MSDTSKIQDAPYTWETSRDTMIRLAAELGHELAFVDFEFNSSNEKKLNLVSCSLDCSLYSEPLEYWLHNDYTEQERLKRELLRLKADGVIFVAYAAAAEARSFMAMGLDPHDFDWIDLYSEWRQLTYNNNRCEYGTIYTKTGFKMFSVPPKFDSRRNEGRNNTKVGMGLVGCAGQMLGVCIDSQEKDRMRDLILENKDSYNAEERGDIVAYCTSDILYLPFILEKQFEMLSELLKSDLDTILGYAVSRGDFICSVAKMENIGFPLDMPSVLNLRKNFALAQDTLITDLVETHYPFFVKTKKRKSDFVGVWTDKYTKFEEFIESKGMTNTWPRTEKGKLSTEDKVLESFDGIPEIKAYRQVKKLIKQMAWFREIPEHKRKKDGDFFDNVGVDFRLRSFLGAFGTQTSRNAPKASRFVLAMSAWLRCLIKPFEGRSIIGIDYASQEFAIAAVLSQDDTMMEAYRSGDPYLYFAKRAGAVPEEAEPVYCKTPAVFLKEELTQLDDIDFFHMTDSDRRFIQMEYPNIWSRYSNYLAYEIQRNLFKATTLGLQYGMGPASLALKLTADIGRTVTEKEADKLLRLHQRTFPTYWAWLKKQVKLYRRQGSLTLWDGWSLLPDNENDLSVKNFPVQGTGAVIMREAVRLAHHDFNLDILAPLHDALYCECDSDKEDETVKVLSECMLKAVSNVLGDELEIRLDIDVHGHDDTWIEGKGAKYYEMLSKYLEEMESSQDVEDRMMSSVGEGPY